MKQKQKKIRKISLGKKEPTIIPKKKQPHPTKAF
jgi:hypothetical protein